jgi:hypothetical protein
VKNCALLLVLALATGVAAQQPRFAPGGRVLLDAHNAYPYQGRWSDRIDRALAAGMPLAIEQDLVWRGATPSRPAHSIVSHGEPFTGDEPTLRDFFERLRPAVTRALKDDSRDRWPLVTLNLDFKDNDPEHLSAVWRLLGEYEHWLTTAVRVEDAAAVQPLAPGALLVLTGADPAQGTIFHDAVPVGSRLRLFGAVQAGTFTATNYLRWSNNPWSVIESEGQNLAGEWTADDDRRLRQVVDAAHRLLLLPRRAVRRQHLLLEPIRAGQAHEQPESVRRQPRGAGARRAGVLLRRL